MPGKTIRILVGGVKEGSDPMEKVKLILTNYKDRYLKHSETFPGGCIFITFSVEFDDQIPHLSEEVNKGFIGFKSLLKRLLDECQNAGELNPIVNTEPLAEMLFHHPVITKIEHGEDNRYKKTQHQEIPD